MSAFLAAEWPGICFGTSGLGNLFTALPFETKRAIVGASIECTSGKTIFDSAGKYGAGLALEVLGDCFAAMQADPAKVVVSNKLGWYRTALKTAEPTFEPGVWKDLQHDAVQRISYNGILECFEQGNELLKGFIPQMVSVHDPDEYLAGAANDVHAHARFDDILNAYQALRDLKDKGKVSMIGVGAKDWRVIRRIAEYVDLDWIMIANSMTVKSHPAELLDFIAVAYSKGIRVINSAVFHSGFLVGGAYYDYRLVGGVQSGDLELLTWRRRFFELCDEFNVKPAAACVQFAVGVPGVVSIALNTTDPSRVPGNVGLVENRLPESFWQALKENKLIDFIPVF